MAREKIGERMSLILDDEIREEIEAVMTSTGEKTAATLLRKAIKAGLPLLKSGGAADVLTLDSELSQAVDAEARRGNRSRNSVILEAIRHGIEAVGVYAMIKEAKETQDLSDAMAQAILATYDLTVHPEKRAAKVAMRERALYWEQVWDLVLNVPEARERKEAIEKLIALRVAAKDWPRVWGCGLRTSEIKWQIEMYEKYGTDPKKIPEEEVERRRLEREAEERANPRFEGSPDVEAIPRAIRNALSEPETQSQLLEQAREQLKRQ